MHFFYKSEISDCGGQSVFMSRLCPKCNFFFLMYELEIISFLCKFAFHYVYISFVPNRKMFVIC